MSRAREARNLDLEDASRRSQDDDTEDENNEEETTEPRSSKATGIKSTLTNLTGNPSAMDRKQQQSTIFSLIHDIRECKEFRDELLKPRDHIEYKEERDEDEPPL